MKTPKELHRANFEILTGWSAPNWEDQDARALDGLFRHEVVLSDGELLQLEKLKPSHVIQRKHFSENQDLRLRQMQNAIFSLLFELAAERSTKGRNLVLPGGYVVGSSPPKNDTRFPPAPQMLRLKYDGADRIRALVGIAKYAVNLLATYDDAEVRIVAAETDRWPANVPAQPELSNFQESFSKWSDSIQLAKNRPIGIWRKNLELPRNKVLMHELLDIHRYIVDPDYWNEHRDEFINKELDEMFLQPTKWQERVDEDATGENKLPPLSSRTWKAWRDVIWAKLNEERPLGLHLGSHFPSLKEIDAALMEIGLDGARARVRDDWLKSQAGIRRIGIEERESIEEHAQKLEAKDGKWTGKMAKRLCVDGQPINASAARGKIRRQLELALKHLVK